MGLFQGVPQGLNFFSVLLLGGLHEADRMQDRLAGRARLERECFEQAGQATGDGVVAGGEYLLGAVVGLLCEQLDGVGRRVDWADVHPVERRAEIALGSAAVAQMASHAVRSSIAAASRSLRVRSRCLVIVVAELRMMSPIIRSRPRSPRPRQVLA
ncbi:hypothetical protein [Streptomyces sp. NPDC002346]